MPDTFKQLAANRKDIALENQDIFKNNPEATVYNPNLGIPLGPKNRSPYGFSEEYSSRIPNFAALSPESDLNLIRANNQSGWEQFGNVAKRAIPDIALGTISNLASIMDVEDYKNSDDEFGNPIENWADGAMEAVRNYFPIYQTNPGESFNFSDPGYIWENVSQLIDSSGSFVATGLITGGILGGVMKAATAESTIAKLASKFVPKAMKLVKSGALAEADVEKYALSMVNKSINGFTNVANTLALNQAEGVMEGVGVYKQSLQEGLDKGYDLDTAKQRAADAAELDVDINRINLLSNFTSAGLFTRSAGHIKDMLGGKLNTVMAEALQEASEEGVNYIAQMEGMKKSDDGDKYSFDFKRAISNLATEKGLEAMALGAIGGAAQTALTDIVMSGAKDATKKAVNKAKDTVDNLNSAKKTPDNARRQADVIIEKNANIAEFMSTAKDIKTEDEFLEKSSNVLIKNTLADLEADPVTHKNLDKSRQAYQTILDDKQSTESEKLMATFAIENIDHVKDVATRTESGKYLNPRDITIAGLEFNQTEKNLKAAKDAADKVNADPLSSKDSKDMAEAAVIEATKIHDASEQKLDNLRSKEVQDGLRAKIEEKKIKEKAKSVAEAVAKAASNSKKEEAINAGNNTGNKPSSSAFTEVNTSDGKSVSDKYLEGRGMGILTTKVKGKDNKHVENLDAEAGLIRNDSDDQIKVIKSGGDHIAITNIKDDNSIDARVIRGGFDKNNYTDDDIVIGAMKMSVASEKMDGDNIISPMKNLVIGGKVINSSDPAFAIIKEQKIKDEALSMQIFDDENKSDEQKSAERRQLSDTQNARMLEALRPLIGDKSLLEYFGVTSTTSKEFQEEQFDVTQDDDDPFIESQPEKTDEIEDEAPDGSFDKFEAEKGFRSRDIVIAVNYLHEEYSISERYGVINHQIVSEHNMNNSPLHVNSGMEVYLTVPSDEYFTYERGDDGKLVIGDDGKPKKNRKTITGELSDKTKTKEQIAAELPIEIRDSKTNRLIGHVQTMSWTSETGSSSGGSHNFVHFSKEKLSIDDINEAREKLMASRMHVLNTLIENGEVKIDTNIISVSYGIANVDSVDNTVADELNELEDDNLKTLGASYFWGIVNGSDILIPQSTGKSKLIEAVNPPNGSPVVILSGANGKPMYKPVVSKTITEHDPVINHIRNGFIAFRDGLIGDKLIKHFLKESEVEPYINGKPTDKNINEAFRRYISQFIRINSDLDSRGRRNPIYFYYDKGVMHFRAGRINLNETDVNSNKAVGADSRSEAKIAEFTKNIDKIVSAIAGVELQHNFSLDQLIDNKPIISLDGNGNIQTISESVSEYYKTTTKTNLRSAGKVKAGSSEVNIYVKQAVLGVNLDLVAPVEADTTSSVPNTDAGDIGTIVPDDSNNKAASSDSESALEDTIEDVGEKLEDICVGRTRPTVKRDINRRPLKKI